MRPDTLRAALAFAGIIFVVAVLSFSWGFNKRDRRYQIQKEEFVEKELVWAPETTCSETISMKWIDRPKFIKGMQSGDTAFIRHIVIDSLRRVWVSLEDEISDTFAGWNEIRLIKNDGGYVVNLSNYELRKLLVFSPSKMERLSDKYVRVCVVEGEHRDDD